jgi:beta-glucosidase-like glycosyl hydrolase
MTVEEKVTLTTGIQQGDDPSIQVGCVGNSFAHDSTSHDLHTDVGFIKGVPRLGFNGMCFQDAGNGVRSSDGVSAYPAGITGAASWNRSGVYHRGFFLGKEFKARNCGV